MKPWMMPRVRIERFAANEYVSSCQYPKTVLHVDTPVQETNGIPGWQQHNAPAGYTIDKNGVAGDGYIEIDPALCRIVGKDDFPDDDTNSYYMITLTEDVISSTGKVYYADTILYKNYSPGAVETIEKNVS